MAILFTLILNLVWVGVCVEILVYISVPAGLVLAAAGLACGVSIAVYHLASVLVGRAPGTDMLSPSGVAAGRLGGRVSAAHVRRDRAWPQYFAAQVRLDFAGVVRSTRRSIDAIWRWGAAPLRRRTGRMVFYLWPFLLVGLAGMAGIAIGAAAVLLVAVVAIGSVTTVAWAVGLACVFALRGLDRLWQAAAGASASCPACYAVSALPAYRCAGPHLPYERVTGDDLHRDLRPGRLGVLWRRCACGRRLPTTLLRASHRLDPRCPVCGAALHPGAGVATDVRIPVFGATSSGKTHLIVSSVVYLLDSAGAGTVTLVDDHSRRKADEFRAYVAEGRAVPKTDAAAPPAAVTVRIGSARGPALVHLFDAAGEALADPAQNAAFAYLDHARTLLFVLDPFSVPTIRDQMAARYAGVFGEANPAQSDPEQSYHATVGRLRLSGVRTGAKRLAFVVTKHDLLARLPLADALGTGSPEVREWLVRQGLDNLVLCAERDFGDVRFFAASSKDRSPSGSVAPVRWLLDTQHVPLRGGSGIPRHRAAADPDDRRFSEVEQA